MSEIFGFSQFEDHDFFHTRYGRGAVIVAVKKQNDGSPRKETINSDIHIAKIFNSRDQNTNSALPYFDPVQSIEEKDGIIRVIIKFDRRSPNKPSYRPVSALIERVLPASQVTFEVVKENESA